MRNWLFFVLALSLTGCSYSKKASRKKLEAARKQAPYDAIIVPGVPLENGQWSRIMKGRVYWAKYLYDQGITKNIIFSGGAVYTPYVEAEVMKKYAIALSLPADHLFAEDKAEHSTENVFYSYQLAKEKGMTKLALASDPFQTKLLRKFTRKKVNAGIAMIPMQTEIMKELEPGMTDPVIDFSGIKKEPFTSIKDRESFWKRWRGTRGKNIPYGDYSAKKPFRVIAFFTAKNDKAHISFVQEANRYFPQAGKRLHFSYDTTSNWNNLNTAFLQQYQLVLFLDTRPEKPEQRAAFQQYMEKGGAWIGFHFAGFALTPSDFPQNWDWYHDQFIGAGAYKGNTWRPVPAKLKVEHPEHPVAKNLPPIITTAPSEWYSWEKDLYRNPDIDVLLSVDSSSFPLGTGPKAHEIWHSGRYPIVWTNRHYHMLYLNMGHNDMDYEGGTNRELSSTFSSPDQNRMLENAICWLAGLSGQKVY